MVSARKKVENDFFSVFPPHDTKKTLFFFLFTINALRNQKLAECELVCNSPDFCHTVLITIEKDLLQKQLYTQRQNANIDRYLEIRHQSDIEKTTCVKLYKPKKL